MPPAPRPPLKMLVFDSAYTHAIMVERDLFELLKGRDLDGFFDHVWTVHPVASLLGPAGPASRFGAPDRHPISERHTMIEGKIARFPWLRRLPPVNFLAAQFDLLRHLSRLIRKEGIAIIRAEDPWYNGLLALLLARWHRLPLMIGVWGNPGEARIRTRKPIMPRLFGKVWIEESVERLVLRSADRVMVQNEDNRQWVLDQAVPYEKTLLFRLGNALHARHFQPPEERASPAEDLAEIGAGAEPILLCIARLEEAKLTDHVVRAVKCLKDRGICVKAVFAGDGSFRPAMEALAETLGVTGEIVLCGNRDQEWLARVAPAVAAIVSPSTGRALAEAALAGAPIVAYDVDWQRELIESGVTGELVPLGDHVGLADAVERILADPERARRLGRNVRERACEMMDPAAANRVQMAAYDSLLAERRPAGSGKKAGRPDDSVTGPRP
jgi:glycosyltransferase involved in cell wall biosynthesis